MRTRRIDLAGRGVVVVGATSGVGRAAAEEFATHRCRLVLAARSADELEIVAATCMAAGAVSVAISAIDIASAADVDRLHSTAHRALGRVDVWVNTASVLVAGDLVDCPPADLERLVATNVLGTMLTSRAALRLFDAQGSGTLINVSSLLGLVPNPLVPTYCSTKFAIRGLTLALQHSARPAAIRCCVVVPGPIDTPMFSDAANHTGRALRSIPPAGSPWRVAASIVRCARRPRNVVTTGVTGWSLLLAHRLLPGFTEWFVARTSAILLTQAASAPTTSGTLNEPPTSGHVDGGWRRIGWRRRTGDRLGRWWALR
jgi:short-subunit dehydrogenase